MELKEFNEAVGEDVAREFERECTERDIDIGLAIECRESAEGVLWNSFCWRGSFMGFHFWSDACISVAESDGELSKADEELAKTDEEYEHVNPERLPSRKRIKRPLWIRVHGGK